MAVAFVCRSRDFAHSAVEHLTVLIAGDIAAALWAAAIACAGRTLFSCCLNATVSPHRARRLMPRLRDQTMRASCNRVGSFIHVCVLRNPTELKCAVI